MNDENMAFLERLQKRRIATVIARLSWRSAWARGDGRRGFLRRMIQSGCSPAVTRTLSLDLWNTSSRERRWQRDASNAHLRLRSICRPFWLVCARSARPFRTHGRGVAAILRWRIWVCRPSPCFSCKARRFYRSNVHCRKAAGGRTARPCSGSFGIEKIPSDNYIRDMLGAADPVLLQPCFERVEQLLAESRLREAFGRLGGRTLIAWDGTEYFCS
jgi:hypothetical protein